MTALHIRDVPDATVAALRERARREGVSMQAALRRILNEAAAAPVEVAPLEPLRLTTTRTSGLATWRREDLYDDAGR